MSFAKTLFDFLSIRMKDLGIEYITTEHTLRIRMGRSYLDQLEIDCPGVTEAKNYLLVPILVDGGIHGFLIEHDPAKYKAAHA